MDRVIENDRFRSVPPIGSDDRCWREKNETRMMFASIAFIFSLLSTIAYTALYTM